MGDRGKGARSDEKKIPWAQDAFSLLCSVSPAGQERGKEHQLKVEKNIINPKKHS